MWAVVDEWFSSVLNDDDDIGFNRYNVMNVIGLNGAIHV